MAHYNGKLIENLKPLEALLKGYMLPVEAHLSQAWIDENLAERHSNTIIYVNGVYVGVAKRTTPLYEIINKFGL